MNLGYKNYRPFLSLTDESHQDVFDLGAITGLFMTDNKTICEKSSYLHYRQYREREFGYY